MCLMTRCLHCACKHSNFPGSTLNDYSDSPCPSTYLGQFCFLFCLQEVLLHILYELILAQYQVSKKEKRESNNVLLRESKFAMG